MGIFWYCPASRRLLRVLAKAESNQVQRNGNWIDFEPGHVDIWPQVEAQIDWSLYPEYDGEYFYLPRGRILWHVERNRHRALPIYPAAIGRDIRRPGRLRRDSRVRPVKNWLDGGDSAIMMDGCFMYDGNAFKLE